MHLDALTLLPTLIDAASVNEASRRLEMHASTVSRRLAGLEASLGGPLFDRTPEGLIPTALALQLRPHAEAIVGQRDDVLRVLERAHAEPHGRVRLAVVEGMAPYLLLPRLPALRVSHPGIQLDLLSGHAVVDLVRREADLALRFIAPTEPDLVKRHLGDLTLRPYVHPTLLEADGMSWLGFFDPSAKFAETRWLARHAGHDRLTTVSSWHDLLAGAKQGVGAALLADFVGRREGLVPIPDMPRVPSRSLFLVYHRASRHVPRIRAVKDWVMEAASLTAMTDDVRRCS